MKISSRLGSRLVFVVRNDSIVSGFSGIRKCFLSIWEHTNYIHSRKWKRMSIANACISHEEGFIWSHIIESICWTITRENYSCIHISLWVDCFSIGNLKFARKVNRNQWKKNSWLKSGDVRWMIFHVFNLIDKLLGEVLLYICQVPENIIAIKGVMKSFVFSPIR